MTTEAAQRRSLQRNRWIASGLLILMAVLSVATLAIPDGFWTLLIRASAEAALVGGLADWFAVTALFRRPLGLPIPHTAIVPRSKDRIGDGLVAFLERHFLTQELLAASLRSVDPARRLAEWLAAPRNAERLAKQSLHLLPRLIHAVDDREIRAFFAKSLHKQLHEIDFDPFLALAMGELAASGYHGTLIDDALKACRDFLERKEERFEELVAERHQGWMRKAIDRQIARAIIHGVSDLIDDLMQHDSLTRRKLLETIEERVEAAIAAPTSRSTFEDAKQRLFDHPDVQSWLYSIWEKARDATLEDLASPSSKAQQVMASSFGSLAVTLANDPAFSKRLNVLLEATTRDFLPWRKELLDLITEVVRAWDAQAFSERIELAVGRDLQYIRMNGTIVGGLIGCLLYLGKSAFG